MIEIKNVDKIYKDLTVGLKNINLVINDNETIILKGKSGSGKSTLLSILVALSKPTNGEVIINDIRVSKLPDSFASIFRRDNIGFIFQKFHLIPTISVFDNIITPLLPMDISPKEMQSKADIVMKQFDIIHKKNQKVKVLSGGEQQRVAIARALVNNPSIIIADEPTANLDSKLSNEFLKYIKELNGKKTIIVATHDNLFFNQGFQEIQMKDGNILTSPLFV